MRQIRQLYRGFSLLEVIVVVFLISVAFVLYQVALRNVFLSRNAKDQEIALRIASDKLEELRTVGYVALPASGSFAHPQLGSLPAGTGALSVSTFNPETKEVSVTVSWTEPSLGSARSVFLSTLITEIGGL